MRNIRPRRMLTMEESCLKRNTVHNNIIGEIANTFRILLSGFHILVNKLHSIIHMSEERGAHEQ